MLRSAGLNIHVPKWRLGIPSVLDGSILWISLRYVFNRCLTLVADGSESGGKVAVRVLRNAVLAFWSAMLMIQVVTQVVVAAFFHDGGLAPGGSTAAPT
jgi:hypothetical protein